MRFVRISLTVLAWFAMCVAGAAVWSPQFAAAVTTTINSVAGAFFLGGGLTSNTELVQPQISPWDPFTGNNVINPPSSSPNVLRNATQTSWDHYKYVTQDKPLTNPYTLGIASFTAKIDNGSGSAGTTLTVSGTPTGTLAPFQRITDAVTVATNGSTAAGTNVLHFASTTGITSGMYVYDVTTPRAIAGNITVSSTTTNTVTLSDNVGFTGNNQTIGSPGVGNTDTIAFSVVKRGTYIVNQVSGTPGAAGTYTVSVSQLAPASGTETMQSAGGWGPEGVYLIPVGTPGTSSVTCFATTGLIGLFVPTKLQCTANASLTDFIVRFPVDYVDMSRLNCSVYTGTSMQCVTTDILLQPMMFQLFTTYSTGVATVPSLGSKMSCPLHAPSNPSGTNLCHDDWTNATVDLVPGSLTLPACTGSSTPVTCSYTAIWTPTGIGGDYEIEFHLNGMATNQFIIIDGFELKQAPGATCAGVAPPCLQTNAAPLDLPEVVEDRHHNMRFAQLLGQGWATGINPGNLGFVETAAGYAISSTQFLATFPLPVGPRCDAWDPGGPKSAPTCPPPYFYVQNPTDMTFNTNSGSTSATAVAVNVYGYNTIQILGTVASGLTAGNAGYVKWGQGNSDLMLIDSAIIGD